MKKERLERADNGQIRRSRDTPAWNAGAVAPSRAKLASARDTQGFEFLVRRDRAERHQDEHVLLVAGLLASARVQQVHDHAVHHQMKGHGPAGIRLKVGNGNARGFAKRGGEPRESIRPR
jgi:hypothetical protein